VHLHHHARGAALIVQRLLHGDHRQLDEVGRRALHRRVDGLALGAGCLRGPLPELISGSHRRRPNTVST
jgi:hypothetical protein